MKPKDVSASAFCFQGETNVTVTFKLPGNIATDADGIVLRAARHKFEKAIEDAMKEFSF